MILYEVVRSDTVVARGTIISVNPKTTLGGVALGKHVTPKIFHSFKISKFDLIMLLSVHSIIGN